MDSQQDVTTGRWNPQHFKSLATLGKGNYATVHLVECSQTRRLYAMKVRSKLLARSNSEPIATEKTLLLLASREKHPFIVEVFGGFQTPSFFILYLEFCQGGDLLQYLQSAGKFDVERVR
jgi:serine/threonine protein kinase